MIVCAVHVVTAHTLVSKSRLALLCRGVCCLLHAHQWFVTRGDQLAAAWSCPQILFFWAPLLVHHWARLMTTAYLFIVWMNKHSAPRLDGVFAGLFLPGRLHAHCMRVHVV